MPCVECLVKVSCRLGHTLAGWCFGPEVLPLLHAHAFNPPTCITNAACAAGCVLLTVP